MIVGYLECTFAREGESASCYFSKKKKGLQVASRQVPPHPHPPSTKQSVQPLNSIYSEMQISSVPLFFALFREPGILVGDAELNIFMLK